MKDKLEGMNGQFKAGYLVGASIVYNCLGSNGVNNISQSCEAASKCYSNSQSEDFISGMDTAISGKYEKGM